MENKSTEESKLRLLRLIGFLNWADIPAEMNLLYKLFDAFDDRQVEQIMTQIIKTDKWKEDSIKFKQANEMLGDTLH